MKIRNVNVKISIITVVVVVFFTVLLFVAAFIVDDITILYWGIPTVILLLLIPLGLNYLSQSQYADLEPVYAKEAKTVRIKLINQNMVGQPVRIEGVVERVYFQFLNRPQYMVADRSGEISVKMFTGSRETIKEGDIVEVLGMVIKRYFFGGDPVINCVSIKKIDKTIETMKKSETGKK
ncbi:MAG TPA: nucleotide-binding protein [Methanoregulaceae archaeon]|nr:nucleotide-binding protein [Methanoregulaceae archaeon]